VQADFGKLSVASVYVPSGTSSQERLAIKFKFLERFLPYLKELRRKRRQFILCGDWNIAHKEIDLRIGAPIGSTRGSCPRSARGWIRSSARPDSTTRSGS
jgi:exodeoxyribonuclease-3